MDYGKSALVVLKVNLQQSYIIIQLDILNTKIGLVKILLFACQDKICSYEILNCYPEKAQNHFEEEKNVPRVNILFFSRPVEDAEL